MTKDEELRPCPCCGAHLPCLKTISEKHHTIRCTECPIRGEFFSSSRAQAIEAWNRRAASVAPSSEPTDEVHEAPTKHMPDPKDTIEFWMLKVMDWAGSEDRFAASEKLKEWFQIRLRQHADKALLAAATTAPSSEPTESMLEAGAAVLYGGSREKARAHVKEDYFESDMHIAGKVYSAMRAEAPATAVLPEGWKIERRTDGRISVVKEGYGGAYVKDDPGFVTAETTLHFLAEDLLAAVPAAPLNTQPTIAEQIASWLRRNANAEQNPDKRAAFIEAHNAARAIISAPLNTAAPTEGE